MITKYFTQYLGDFVLECTEHATRGERDPQRCVAKADAVYCTAPAAGAISLQEPKDLLYGERNSAVMDAWGNH